MKIAWIYPIEKKCGISFYSNNYINELKKLILVDCYDIENIHLMLKSTPSLLDNYDLVHIQYETSLFYLNKKDYYRSLIKKIKIPIVTSLHEVYETIPGVYPREKITGMLSPIRRLIYDIKHPLQHLLNTHQKNFYYSDIIIVHYHFQKEILINKGFPEKKIKIIELPFEKQTQIKISSFSENPISLGCIGFINLNYDYNFLFKVLHTLKIPWKFKWLGGLRTKGDSDFYQSILNKIKNYKFENEFIISNWLNNKDFQYEMSQFDILLHFFKNRSSSSSLCKSISFGIPVLATQLPLTNEISKKCEIQLINTNDVHSTVDIIEELYNSKSKRVYMSDSEFQYAKLNTYQIQTEKLIHLYREIIK